MGHRSVYVFMMRLVIGYLTYKYPPVGERTKLPGWGVTNFQNLVKGGVPPSKGGPKGHKKAKTYSLFLYSIKKITNLLRRSNLMSEIS